MFAAMVKTVLAKRGTRRNGLPFTVIVSSLSDKGCMRDSNEDRAKYIQPTQSNKGGKQGLLALVADGMGGHNAGEVASEIAVRIIEQVYYSQRGDPHKALRKAFLVANRKIHRASIHNTKYKGMGTTCSSIVLKGNFAYCAHVGDSRLYLVRGDSIYRMTEDHSPVMQMVKEGQITHDQASGWADRNFINRAVGTHPKVEISTWCQPFPIKARDRFLLCTDGLSDLVEDEEIMKTLQSDETEIACEKLVALAKRRGGHDNITVLLLCLHATTSAENSVNKSTALQI
jgi:serine/threonine protein phosphatase PrpC